MYAWYQALIVTDCISPSYAYHWLLNYGSNARIRAMLHPTVLPFETRIHPKLLMEDSGLACTNTLSLANFSTNEFIPNNYDFPNNR